MILLERAPQIWAIEPSVEGRSVSKTWSSFDGFPRTERVEHWRKRRLYRFDRHRPPGLFASFLGRPGIVVVKNEPVFAVIQSVGSSPFGQELAEKAARRSPLFARPSLLEDSQYDACWSLPSNRKLGCSSQ